MEGAWPQGRHFRQVQPRHALLSALRGGKLELGPARAVLAGEVPAEVRVKSAPGRGRPFSEGPKASLQSGRKTGCGG